jgi:hypothetical protein
MWIDCNCDNPQTTFKEHVKKIMHQFLLLVFFFTLGNYYYQIVSKNDSMNNEGDREMTVRREKILVILY